MSTMQNLENTKTLTSNSITTPAPNPNPNPVQPFYDSTEKDESPIDLYTMSQNELRELFPDEKLPKGLDLRWAVVEEPQDIPLVWYGLPWTGDNVLAYAKKHDLVVFRYWDPEKPNILQTLTRVINHFRRKSGVHICLVEVWDFRDILLGFFVNRQAPKVLPQHCAHIREFMRDAGYPEDARPEWYLDLRENLEGGSDD